MEIFLRFSQKCFKSCSKYFNNFSEFSEFPQISTRFGTLMRKWDLSRAHIFYSSSEFFLVVFLEFLSILLITAQIFFDFFQFFRIHHEIHNRKSWWNFWGILKNVFSRPGFSVCLNFRLWYFLKYFNILLCLFVAYFASITWESTIE